MARRTIAIGILGACLVLAAGCIAIQPKPDGSWSVSLFPPSSSTTVTGGTTGTSAGKPSASTRGSVSKVGTSENPAEPGTTLQSDAWQALVEGTSSPKRLEGGSRPSAGHRFLVIDVSVRNVGVGDALLVTPKEFSLVDRSGRAIRLYSTRFSMYNAQSVRPIDAGMGGFTAMVYEVPLGDATYTFTLTPTESGAGSMSWVVP